MIVSLNDSAIQDMQNREFSDSLEKLKKAEKLVTELSQITPDEQDPGVMRLAALTLSNMAMHCKE